MASLISVIGSLSGSSVNSFPLTLPVYQGAGYPAIKKGYLVIKDGSHAGFWKAAADAATTDECVAAGIATSDSTELTAANGTVTVETAPVLLVNIKAKTPASLTTAMPSLAYILDVTSGSYTLDQGTSTKGIFRLISYDNITDGNCVAALNTYW